MLQLLRTKVKAAMTPDQVAALRIFLAGLGRRKGTDLEELWLDRLARSGDIKTFVQIGANDGNEADPVASIIRRHRLKGIMAEPIPYYFEKLRKRYAHREDITVVNTAIAESEEERTLYHLPPDHPNLPGWANGLGSFDRDMVLSHAHLIPDIGQMIVETKVPCIPLGHLLAMYRLLEFDLLVTDTEGYDYKIVKQVNFGRSQPKVIVYESMYLSSDERADCEAMLESQGYQLRASNENTIAFRGDIANKLRLR